MSCHEELPCNSCNDCPACGSCPEECTCTLPDYDNTGCVHTDSSDCITFNGDALPCIPIQKGNTITLVIQRIVAYLKNLWNHVNSDSLVITPSGGVCNSDLNIEIVPSADAGNTFTLGTDGYPFVPTPVDSIGDVNIISGDCIVWTKTVVAGVPTFTYEINWNCVASHICPLCAGTLCPNPLNLTVN
jgi:hypothetical protein